MSRKIKQYSQIAEKYNREIGKRIKSLRLKTGLSQADFAEKIKVSQPGLYRWEAGTREISALAVKMIAEEFDCSLEWLINGESGDEKD